MGSTLCKTETCLATDRRIDSGQLIDRTDWNGNLERVLGLSTKAFLLCGQMVKTQNKPMVGMKPEKQGRHKGP